MASDGDARSGLGVRSRLGPVEVAAGLELRRRLLALKDDAVVRSMRGLLEGTVEERLVFDDAVDLDAARPGQHDLRPRIVDANRELMCGEAAEDDRVDRAEPRTREHGEDRLRHHRHVDDDRVAHADTEPGERSRESGHLVPELGVREDSDRPRDRAVVDERRLVGTAAVGVTVDGVRARVQDAVGEPAVERWPRIVEDPLRLAVPVDSGRRLAPEGLPVLQAAAVRRFVGAHAQLVRSYDRPAEGRKAESEGLSPDCLPDLRR